MIHQDIAAARNIYSYIPAKFVVWENENPDLAWSDLRLKISIPTSSRNDWINPDIRRQFSSIELDGCHKELLSSDRPNDRLHGLLSVVFWGYASGSDGIIRPSRALGKARIIIDGHRRSRPQDQDEIQLHLIKTLELVKGEDFHGALLSAMKIKFLGMSFSSKIIAFMAPEKAVVYDSVIASILKEYNSVLHVDPSENGNRHTQAKIYADWCDDCRKKSEELNQKKIQWTDWDGGCIHFVLLMSKEGSSH